MERELSSLALGGNKAMGCDQLNIGADKSLAGDFLLKACITVN